MIQSSFPSSSQQTEFKLERLYECSVCKKADSDREPFDVPGAPLAGYFMCRECAKEPVNLIPYLEKPKTTQPTKIKTICPPESLGMKCSYECTLCKEVNEKGKHWEITESYLHGWIMCSKCMEKPTTKQELMNYLVTKQYIPLGFLQTRDKTLSFYNPSTNSVIEGVLPLSEPENLHFMCKTKKSGMYMVRINFSLAGPKDPKLWIRSVSLENLFYHNKWLYETLVTSKNLLGSSQMPLKITWSDFPQTFRDEVDALYRVALESKTGVFTV